MGPELQARALARYEAGRRALAVRRTGLMVALIAAIALVLRALGYLRPNVVIGCGLGIAGLVYWATVRGGAAWRGVRIGAASGLLPLAVALGSESVGMVCTPAGCSSLCVPGCVVSGLFAAWLIGRRGRGVEYWAPAGLAATAVGAVGCACVSYTGALALAASMILVLGGAAVNARLEGT